MNPTIRNELIRVIKFGIIGLITTATHVVIVLILVELKGYPPLTANIFGFSMAVLASFGGNHHWTFNSSNRYRESFPKFSVIALLGLTMNQAIMFGSVNVLGLDYRAGLAAVIIIVPMMTFTANKYWAFQPSKNI